MEIVAHSVNNMNVAEIRTQEILINSAENGLDLLGDMYYQGFDGIVLYGENFNPEFFNLKNGLAGEILQKFSNYRMKLSIVGSFENVESKSLRDFIYECNKGQQISFVATLEAALKQISKR